MKIPESERQKFENLISVQANKYGLDVENYLRKVWYHEEAVKFGEFVAGSLLNELTILAPLKREEESL